MTNIKKQTVSEINISFERDYKGGKGIHQSTPYFKPIISPNYPDIVYLYIQIESFVESLQDEFRIDASITISYQLNKTENVEVNDLYECVGKTIEHLQNVFNAIFYDKLTPSVAIISFDDISDTLDELLLTLYQ